jgi:preprotein translocase subunit SecE
MAKSNRESSFVSELGATGLYKRNQGKLTRQLTFAALGLIVALGSWTLSKALGSEATPIRVGLPTVIAIVGCWVIFRSVNYPKFADFLIAVEAEVDKVTWASKPEVYRATVVVLVTMFSIGLLLFAFDLIWQTFFEMINVLQI